MTTMFIKTTFKHSKKVKRIRNYVLKYIIEIIEIIRNALYGLNINVLIMNSNYICIF